MFELALLYLAVVRTVIAHCASRNYALVIVLYCPKYSAASHNFIVKCRATSATIGDIEEDPTMEFASRARNIRKTNHEVDH